MKWMMKAAAGHVLSRAPGGRRLHYLVQRYVTRSLPMPMEDFDIRLRIACQHLLHHRRVMGDRPLAEATFLEFGAGWDLTVPLVYRAAGVGHQLLFDLEALAQPDLISVSRSRLREAIGSSKVPSTCAPLLDAGRLPPSGPLSPAELDEWLRRLGITYLAPSDARATRLAAASVDVVTSTATLEHIPERDIARIFREMFRVLRAGGMMSCQVDMSDHFSHGDATISPWHFLRFGERTWRLIDPPMLYMNRLRASAYASLARAEGFDVVEFIAEYPNDMDPSRIDAPVVHPSFVRYEDHPDLVATRLQLVCVKPASVNTGAGSP
ncbi:MAG TPA: class I SAM-dependent methyltransferase [Gemmatimonadaceae bacterium]|jgi:SAM-dependent methyltransferase|nr:class I SAM-dependent methyltransferase [Gemmatimonadaceae bacterium]